ncbi:MAG: fasciclin domain-containing protein [Alphaproteobacteria bacterium]|nr:fasciclin domain-containing protein [Alphaproteobacteria bacterium]MBU2378411.1 fasciclin domain-containing protein [Alphaproteobacteria bacterium]
MLRTRLLTATAAVALFAAGSTYAQSIPAPSGSTQTTTGQSVMQPAAPDSTPPAATQPAETPATAPAQTAPVAAAAAGAQTPAAANTVIDVLRSQGQFTTLLAALDSAQLTDTLASQPAISIFAPTDAAFAALPEADRTRLMDPANVNELRQLLLYHVVVADVNSSQIEGAKGGVQTAATSEVQLDGTGSSIKVDNATVTTADIDASNGAVFAIDQVLNPAQSQVAAGDAEEAAPPAGETDMAAPQSDDTVEAAPPADETVDEPMTDDPMTDEADDTMTPPAATTAAPVGPTTPPTTMPATTPPAAAPSMTAPATPTNPESAVNAPNGQPADSVTTTASPPVPNPTDGQVDDEPADATDDAMAPTPQS